MRALAIACGIVLAGCGPPRGLPGEEGIAYFDTPRLCAACRNLTRFARGGRHDVLVSLDYGCTSSWSVEATGVVTELAVSSATSWSDCSRDVSFAAPEAGPFTLEIHGGVSDRIRLHVAEAEELLIHRSRPRGLDRLDPERLVVPLGAYVDLASAARDDQSVLALDDSQVSFTLEGDAITAERTYGEDPAEPRIGQISVGAVALGVGVARAQYERLTTELPIEVVPLEEVRPAEAWGEIFERCDSIDNDRDGSIDEAPESLCRIPNAIAACEAGRCAFVSCQAGFADCDVRPGCETDIERAGDHCGACDNACDRGERCAEGACVPF